MGAQRQGGPSLDKFRSESTLGVDIRPYILLWMVPGGGIEPPTKGL
jgi:hypothetical protein